MNAPITRPLEGADGDEYPARAAVSLNAQKGASISSVAKIKKNINSGNNKPLPWIALAIAASFLSLGLGVGAFVMGRIAEREARLDQYYILELDGKLIKLGVELPEGGLQRFKENRERGAKKEEKPK